MDDARRRESNGDQSDEHSAVLRLLSSEEWQKRLEQARLAREHVLASRPERRSGLAALGPERPTRLRPVPEPTDTEAFFDEDEIEIETAEPAARAPVVMRRLPQPPSVPQGAPPPLRSRPRAVDILPELTAPAPEPAPPPPVERGSRLGIRIVAGFALGLLAGVGTTSILWMTRPEPVVAPATATDAVPADAGTVALARPSDIPADVTSPPPSDIPTDPLARPTALTPGPAPAAPALALAAPAAEAPASLPEAVAPPDVWSGATAQLPAPLVSAERVAVAAGPAAPTALPRMVLPDLAVGAQDPLPDSAVRLAAARPVVGSPADRLADLGAPAFTPIVPGRLPDLPGRTAPALAAAPEAGVVPAPAEPPPAPPVALPDSAADQPAPDVPLTASTPPAGSDWPDVLVKLLVPVEQSDAASSALAGKVRTAGFALDEPASVDLTIKATHVRFYHPGDRAAAEHLAAKIGGEARDFTNASVRVPDGTIELWMQGGGPAAAKPVKAAKAKAAKPARQSAKPSKPAAPREDPQVRILRDKVLGKLKTMNKS